MNDSPLWLYLRCVYWNKFLLAGYLLFFSGLAFVVVGPFLSRYFGLLRVNDFTAMGIFVSELGAILIAITAFGKHTLKIYKRTIVKIQEGVETEKLLDKKAYKYCGRAGARMAVHDFMSKS